MHLPNMSQTNKLLATTELNCRRIQTYFDQFNNAKYDDEARMIIRQEQERIIRFTSNPDNACVQ